MQTAKGGGEESKKLVQLSIKEIVVETVCMPYSGCIWVKTQRDMEFSRNRFDVCIAWYMYCTSVICTELWEFY